MALGVRCAVYGEGVIGVSDLFILGLAFDLSGAVLLARGLLASPEEMVRQNLSWGGVSSSIGRAINDKVFGMLGVGWLVVGFVVQALGYLLTIERGGRSTSSSTSLAAGLGVASILVAFGIAWILRPRLVKWQGRRAAQVALYEITDKVIGARTDPLPYGDRLELVGRFLGYSEQSKGESQEDYALRVWGLSKIQPGTWPDNDARSLPEKR